MLRWSLAIARSTLVSGYRRRLLLLLLLLLLRRDKCSAVEIRAFKRKMFLCFFVFFLCFTDSLCLQCFDAVGWAAGRASGL